MVGWAQRWRMRLQCSASAQSQTVELGLPYCLSVPQRPRPSVAPGADAAGGPVEAAGEAGDLDDGLDEDGVRASRGVPGHRRDGVLVGEADVVGGWGGDSTPAGGTDGVRPGGRGDRRRSGGNTDQAARRSPRGLSRSRRPRPAVIGGRGRTSARAAAWGTRGPGGSGWNLNRERCGSGGFSGGSKGGGALPLASPPRSTWRGLAYNPKSVSQPLGGAAEHASPGIARNSLDQAVAGQAPRPPRRPPQGR